MKPGQGVCKPMAPAYYRVVACHGSFWMALDADGSWAVSAEGNYLASFPGSLSLLMVCFGNWFLVFSQGSQAAKEEIRKKEKRGENTVWVAGLGLTAQLTQMASRGKSISNTCFCLHPINFCSSPISPVLLSWKKMKRLGIRDLKGLKGMEVVI